MSPVIFGYLHLPLRTDDALLVHLRDALTEYAERECFTLAEIFVDRADANRCALVALVDALDRREAEAVVVPALDHLSSLPGTRDAIRRFIEHQTALACWSSTRAGRANVDLDALPPWGRSIWGFRPIHWLGPADLVRYLTARQVRHRPSSTLPGTQQRAVASMVLHRKV